MGQKKILIEGKTRVLTMLENGVLVIRVAVNLHVHMLFMTKTGSSKTSTWHYTT